MTTFIPLVFAGLIAASIVYGWYRFTDFTHFTEIYFAICSCIRTPADFELVTTEFLRTQAKQNIRYSEVIFLRHTHTANTSHLMNN